MRFTTPRWLAVLMLASCMLAGLWLSRGWIDAGARQRLSQQYQQRLLALPEREATQFVRALAGDQPPWLEVLMEATADERPAVATAAATELRQLVLNWAAAPDGHSASQAVKLAALLAKRTSSLPPPGQQLANVLAKSLIVLPINSRQFDLASYIADCEAVLRLELAPPDEIRVAAAVAEPTLPLVGPETQAVEPERFDFPTATRIIER